MTQIPSRTASRLLDGVAFLNDEYGLALNGLVTLNFEQLGARQVRQAKSALTGMNEFLARKLEEFGRQYGEPVQHFYVYAHERCRDHGWHVHELMVVPSALRRDIG